jgi:putative ABC transport system permease protein
MNKSNLSIFFMNLNISLRFLIKNKLFSLLSVLVLTIGMSSFILIYFYIQYERTYDISWLEPERIYRVILEKSLPNGNITTTATNYNGLCRVIADEIPGVAYATGFQRDIVTAYTAENYLKDADFFWCDTLFFKVFDRPFVAGDMENPFPTIQSAVISERAALQLFGEQDPINQHFKVNEGWEFIVSGVFNDIPENSHLKIDILITRKTLHYFINNFDNSTSKLRMGTKSVPLEPAPSMRWLWENPNVYTYIRLKKNIDEKLVEQGFPPIYKKYTGHLIATGQKSKFMLQPVGSIHLNSHYADEIAPNSDKRTITILYVIAILALAMSWVIFINFQITQSMERAKEFGLKKIMGAGTSNLIGQIILQSAIINAASIMLAFGIFSLFKGNFYNFLQIHSQISMKVWTLLLFIAVFISGSIVSSIYPAYILISKSANKLLSENFFHGNDGFNLRRSLIVFQYSASFGLMITTFVIIRQVWFMKNMDVGLNLSQTAFSYTPMSMIKKEGATQKLISFLEETRRITGVVSATVSSWVPGREINFHSNTIYPSGAPEKSGDNFGILTIDHHFQDVFEPKILAGQMFTNEDKQGAPKVVINREACRKLGFDSPEKAVGMFIQFRVNDYLNIPESQYLISGVIEDFHQESPGKKIESCLLIRNYQWKYEVGFISLRLSGYGRDREIIQQVRKKWESFYPGDPFSFQFTKDTYQFQIRNEENLAILSMIYTCLSILLAALGLYGLAANSARKRVKEIGIRKINGATVYEVMTLLNKDFIKWIAISFLIASPIAWYVMIRWLSNFAYKTDISWWLFLIAGLLAISVAIAAVSRQSWNAAAMNPVEALRYE